MGRRRRRTTEVVNSYLDEVFKALGDTPYPSTKLINSIAREAGMTTGAVRAGLYRRRLRAMGSRIKRKMGSDAYKPRTVSLPRLAASGVLVGEANACRSDVYVRVRRQKGRKADTSTAVPSGLCAPAPPSPPMAHAWPCPGGLSVEVEDFDDASSVDSMFTIPDSCPSSVEDVSPRARAPGIELWFGPGMRDGMWVSDWERSVPEAVGAIPC